MGVDQHGTDTGKGYFHVFATFAAAISVSDLISLLWWFWVLCTGAVAVTYFDLPVPSVFKDAVRLSAARGKSWESNRTSLGGLEKASVPHAWFYHFYAIALLSSTACIAVLLALVVTADSPPPSVVNHSLAVLIIVQIHSLRRLLETLFVMRFPSGAKMHIFAYIFAVAYYTILPLSLIPLDQLSTLQPLQDPVALFQVTRTQLFDLTHSGHALAEVHTHLMTALSRCLAGMSSNPSLVLGSCVAIGGQILQFISHRQLASLSRTSTPCAQSYVLPTGGMFECVSCPHYLAEMVIYFGLFVMTGGDYLAAVILSWVVLNLLMGGQTMHEWYQRKFDNYPIQRKAVIPFIL